MAIRIMTGQFGARTGTGFGSRPRTSYAVPRQLSGMGAAPATVAPLTSDPAGPPADATVISANPPVFFDLKSGNIWYNTTKLAIIPGVITAVAIKVIMFGGGVAAKAAKAKFLGSK
jgi:hypothetical protein